jgi:hypothetical protein
MNCVVHKIFSASSSLLKISSDVIFSFQKWQHTALAQLVKTSETPLKLNLLRMISDDCNKILKLPNEVLPHSFGNICRYKGFPSRSPPGQKPSWIISSCK